MNTFSVGDNVRTAETVKPTRFGGRIGRVTELNTPEDEIGVKFGATSRHDEPTVWFGPFELEPGSSLHAHACAPIALHADVPTSRAS